MLRSALAGSTAALATFAAVSARPAAAASAQCHVVDVEFTPAPKLQIVAWLEDSTGKYIDTLFITRTTGTYGLGNRPGIKDFNSSWAWPYGRREYVAPVWAHRHGKSFPLITFQNNDDKNLSHPFDQSSQEHFYCRPLALHEPMWDSQTCATTAFTDKGKPSATETSLYPPRVDVSPKAGIDDPAVATYAAMDPFDAVSMATPLGGMDTTQSWPIPPNLAPGNYVIFVETSQESDFNSTYSTTAYPPPAGIPWSEYGLPARGQPSIVYKVPFTISTDQTIATTSDYAGYGDPEGADGTLHPPDATITTDTPGSGAQRFQLTADGSGGTFRVRVTSRPEFDSIAPAAPADPVVAAVDEKSAVIDFIEPGDDGTVGTVMGYDVRYSAGTPITEQNFASAMPAAVNIVPKGAGSSQSFAIGGLLPMTTYYVGIRAYDECKNYGPLLVQQVTTTDRQTGYVDACFVATAAYGSLLANDVEMLRRFRDQYLQSNVLGELAVETYYSVGPAVAGVVDQSEELRGMARAVLSPVIDVVGRMTARH